MRQDTETKVNVAETMDDASSAGNAGWADVMQKILRTKKPKRKQTVVLAKAKKLCDVKGTEKKESISFEIDGAEDEVATDLEKVNNKVESIVQTKSGRKEKKLGIRIKPCITDRERERTLQKIATK